MIRTVPIPTKVSRMGCTPGGDCCDECRGHAADMTGPPVGPPAIHTHAIPTNRNRALHAHLGDGPGLQCDQDGNCWMNGEPVTGTPVTASSTGPSKELMTYAGVAIGFIVLLELFSRRR